MIARRVVQATDGLQAACDFAAEHARHARQRAAHHRRGMHVDVVKDRRVARVEGRQRLLFGMHDALDMGRRVKAQ